MNNILLHNQKFKKEIQKEVKNYLEANEKVEAHQDSWSAPKAVLLEVSAEANIHSRKKEPSQPNFT